MGEWRFVKTNERPTNKNVKELSLWMQATVARIRAAEVSAQKTQMMFR